jgi:FtsP/CotA-like multicopper oxidase with cupredoxin domain
MITTAYADAGRHDAKACHGKIVKHPMARTASATLCLAIVLPLAVCADDDHPSGKTRVYYVAAEPIDWNYAPLGRDPAFDKPLSDPWGRHLVYPKLHYVQYTDATFTTPVAAPAWAGILGPTLRASVGETIEVVFFNDTARSLSMHPHGVKYDRESEGAAYEPDGEARGIAAPGATITYRWLADENAGPAEGVGSRVWLYHSHVDPDEEIYAGLIGTIVVSDPALARAEDATPTDVDREFTTLFMVFNENTDEEAAEHENEKEDDSAKEEREEGNLKHSINGRIFGNLEGLEMKQGERVRWYVVALGTEVDLHTPHWHGETVTTESGITTDVLELLPASMQTVDMVADNPGTWLYHCHVADHMKAGMYTTFSVR